jgi:hypothetical protein
MGQSIHDIIQNMLNNVQIMINSNTPGNQYYLPTWLVNNNYDPYGANKAISWTVVLTDPGVIQTAASICPTIDITSSPCQDPNAQFIGAQNNNPTLQLGDPNVQGSLQVTGASNADMTAMISDPNNPYNITASGAISTLPNLPQNVILTGQFTFTQYCCCSTDNVTCQGPPVPEVGTGTFTATMVGTPTFQIYFQITNLAQNVLDIKVVGMTFTPPYQQGTQTPNIQVTVNITSIPTGANRQSYNNMAMLAFNSPSALQNIAQQINVILGDPAQLSFFSTVLTGVIDGYLKDNNLYPFGPLQMAVY